MPKIQSLVDALIKTQVAEDQCTNLLLWLLCKVPTQCLQEFCRASGFLLDDISNGYDFDSQWRIENSRPDARIQLARDKFLVIESKRFANAFDKAQFDNHIKGAIKGSDSSNYLFLFISGDTQAPVELEELRSVYANPIGFISWRALLALFDDLKQKLEKPYSLLLNEFSILARHHQLGRLNHMNIDETKTFLAAYPAVNMFQEAAREKFSKMLDTITQQVICNCEERVTVEVPEFEASNLPCPYRTLNVKGWHTPILSGFIFVDILSQRIGVIANGYQNKPQKMEFLPLWNAQFKNIFQADPRLDAFSWADKGEDENNAEYFKLVGGTRGRVFDPGVCPAFEEYFYWGYSYPLDVDMPESLLSQIATDAKEFVKAFTPTKFKRV